MRETKVGEQQKVDEVLAKLDKLTTLSEFLSNWEENLEAWGDMYKEEWGDMYKDRDTDIFNKTRQFLFDCGMTLATGFEEAGDGSAIIAPLGYTLMNHEEGITVYKDNEKLGSINWSCRGSMYSVDVDWEE